MSKKVLISGGSGLVGKRLSQILISKGYEVSHLSRSAKPEMENVGHLQWNIEKQEIDADQVAQFDHIIHLAGAGIVDKAWTNERKRIIEESRTKSSELLINTVAKNHKKPASFVSASAVGYYGFTSQEHIFKESDKPGDDFLADTCVAWENAVDKMKDLGVPTAKIRIGIVLSAKGGALAEMDKPFKMGLGAALGSGKQYMPWIFIDDLCQLFITAMEQNWEGAFNGAAPNQVNNLSFSKTLASILRKKMWLPNVPTWAMKLILGSRAVLVLEGSRVSTAKVESKGFEFTYPELRAALKEIYY